MFVPTTRHFNHTPHPVAAGNHNKLSRRSAPYSRVSSTMRSTASSSSPESSTIVQHYKVGTEVHMANFPARQDTLSNKHSLLGCTFVFPQNVAQRLREQPCMLQVADKIFTAWMVQSQQYRPSNTPRLYPDPQSTLATPDKVHCRYISRHIVNWHSI